MAKFAAIRKTNLAIHPTPYQTDQCIQVIYTGIFNKVNCDLPVYCGTPHYIKFKSAFYESEVGICIGIGSPTIDHHPIGLMDNELHEVYKVIPKSDINTPDYTLIAFCKNKLCWTMSEEYLYMHPQYRNRNFSFDQSNLIKDNGYYCLPKVVKAICPLVRGPYKQQDVVGHMVFWWMRGMVPISYGICIGSSRCIPYGASEVDNSTSNIIIDCNPVQQTSHIIPGLAWITGFVSRSIIVLMHTIWFYVNKLVYKMLHYIIRHLDLVNILTVYYFLTKFTEIEYKQRIIITILLIAVIKNVAYVTSLI